METSLFRAPRIMNLSSLACFGCSVTEYVSTPWLPTTRCLMGALSLPNTMPPILGLPAGNALKSPSFASTTTFFGFTSPVPHAGARLTSPDIWTSIERALFVSFRIVRLEQKAGSFSGTKSTRVIVKSFLVKTNLLDAKECVNAFVPRSAIDG